MAIFEFVTELTQPRDVVFDWFGRPGALVRLSPPFGGSVRREPSDGIRVGSTAELGIGVPGSLGTMGVALGGMGLPVFPVELGWKARHTQLEEGLSFTDVMDAGPMKSWQHEHGFADAAGGGTVMTDRVTFELPRPFGNGWTDGRVLRELERIFAYRARQLTGDLAFHASMTSQPRTVAITGAAGLIGAQVRALLGGGGHRVLSLVRRPSRSDDELTWDPDAGTVDLDRLAECDVVVHLGGHPIGGRFTPATKQKIMSSRTAGTSTLARGLAAVAGDGRDRAFVVASATGYYGAQPHAGQRARGAEPVPLTEDAPAGDDFLASVCVAWEESCRPAREAGVRVVNVRTGLVLSPASGYLSRFLPLFLAGVGGPLGKEAWQSWIGIDDMASVHVRAVLDDALEGPANAVAPEPVTAAEFARVLGRVLRRPSLVPVPAVGTRVLLGEQGARELAQADQRVEPAVLRRAGFEFRHPRLEEQLRHVLGR